MTEAEARALLETMVAASVNPALSVTEIDQLVGLAKRVDSLGRAPNDPAWEPTWNLDAAAAEGWRWKAAKAAAEFDVSVGAGTSFKRSQKYEHCMTMADRYARRSGLVSIPLGPGPYYAGG